MFIRLLILLSSNVTMTNNLVVGVAGWRNVGQDRNAQQWVDDISGQNCVITNNTFVDMDQLVSIEGGKGLKIFNNIVFGLNSSVTDAGWDTPAFILKSEIYLESSNVTSPFCTQSLQIPTASCHVPPISNLSNGSTIIGMFCGNLAQIELDSFLAVDLQSSTTHMNKPVACSISIPAA